MNQDYALGPWSSTMRRYERQTTFQFNWQQIAIAFWRRYPNKHSKHVLSEDVIHRHINREGQLVSRRLFVKTNSCPKWIEKLIPSRKVHVLEDSCVDPKQETLTTITRNIAMTNLMTVEETCVYKPHPENKAWTMLERKVIIDSKLYGLTGRAVKAFGLERYRYNAKKSDKGFLQTLLAHR
ncbi:PRELI domain-containing protein 1, mitochondrial, partial [Fragariocoptes setiger]